MKKYTDKEMKEIMDTVVCKEVIVSTLTRRGNGTPHSPIRVVTQVFEKDGTLIAENDPNLFDDSFALFDLIHFARWCVENKIDMEYLSLSDVRKWLDEINNV